MLPQWLLRPSLLHPQTGPNLRLLLPAPGQGVPGVALVRFDSADLVGGAALPPYTNLAIDLSSSEFFTSGKETAEICGGDAFLLLCITDTEKTLPYESCPVPKVGLA